MGIGQVAGIAAHLSRKLQVEIKDVPVLQLQDILIKNHQILTYFKDIDRADKAFDAVQFWGTKGFFNSYLARTKEKLSYQDYNLWLSILRNMPNMPKDLSAGKPSKSVETVSISTIKKLTQALNKSGDLNLNADSWLYNKREKESEVLRGEACLAMYQLYQNTSLT